MGVSQVIKQIVRITSKIENSSRDVPVSGHSENHFGGYDRDSLTEELLELFESIPVGERDDNIKHMYAEALMRARRYSEAAALLEEIVETDASASLLMAMVQLSLGKYDVADHFISRQNSYWHSIGMESMRVSRDDLIPKR
jgi:hypothetical protein